MNEILIQKTQEEYFENDVCMASLLINNIEEGKSYTDEEIQTLLEWAGEDDCITVSEIREGGVNI